MMSAIPVLFTVWSILVVCFLGLIVYRSQLTRYEEDQLFLANNNAHEQHEQEEIVRKVNRLSPMVRILGGVCGLVTVAIAGTYMWDAWTHLR